MRRSKTLEKIRNGKIATACGVGYFLPAFVTQVADNGFDCMWLDLEHRAMSESELRSLLAFCHLADIDCLVRTRSREPTFLYRNLEDGATGIMLQMVNSVEDASKAVRALKFPPLGERGLDGAGLDCRFMLDADENYLEDANRETFIVAQIETPEAVERVDEIAAVEGVDILFVGAGDLGLRLQHEPRSVTSMDDAFARIAGAAKAHGKTLGAIAVDREKLEQLYAMGAQFVVCAAEFWALKAHAEEKARLFREVCGDG